VVTLAVEGIQRRRTDRTWFIPLRLTDCDVPDREIGGAETLRDIQSLDLFPDFDLGILQLVRALSHLDA
jgi:hypothetical protein